MTTISLSYEAIACVVCGEDNYEPLYQYQKTFQTNDSAYHFDVNEGICKGCGLIYQNPRPDEASLSLYYENKVLHSVGNPDYNLENRLRVLKKFAGARKTLFEIGSNEGSFLQSASADFIVSGYDPINENTREESPAKSYDIVVSNHVLEHINRPDLFLKQIAGRLTNDGLLIFEVPNLHQYNTYSSGIFHEHLYHFSPEKLCVLVESAGFEIVDLEMLTVSRPLGFTVIARKKSVRSRQISNEYQVNKSYYLAAVQCIREKEAKRRGLLRKLFSSQDKKIGFWGANLIMLEMMKAIPEEEHHRILLVDKSESRWNSWFDQNKRVPVCDPRRIKDDLNGGHMVICAVSWEQEIRKELHTLGFSDNFIHTAPY